MSEISDVLNRAIAQDDKRKDHAVQREMGETSEYLTELAALVQRVQWTQLRSEINMLRLEINLYLLELRLGATMKLPKNKAEVLADFAAALRRPH